MCRMLHTVLPVVLASGCWWPSLAALRVQLPRARKEWPNHEHRTSCTALRSISSSLPSPPSPYTSFGCFGMSENHYPEDVDGRTPRRHRIGARPPPGCIADYLIRPIFGRDIRVLPISSLQKAILLAFRHIRYLPRDTSDRLQYGPQAPLTAQLMIVNPSAIEIAIKDGVFARWDTGRVVGGRLGHLD